MFDVVIPSLGGSVPVSRCESTNGFMWDCFTHVGLLLSYGYAPHLAPFTLSGVLRCPVVASRLLGDGCTQVYSDKVGGLHWVTFQVGTVF